MTSDYGEFCRDLRNARREARAKHGKPCPECLRLLPKANPSILLPQQRCKIHGHRDPRPRTSNVEYLTSDRELLERAAKAAGLRPPPTWDAEVNVMVYPFRSELTDGHYWNPLTDDGDALRLAVKLRISIGSGYVGSNDVWALQPGYSGRYFMERITAEVNEYAATRRAIVRAAADMAADE